MAKKILKDSLNNSKIGILSVLDLSHDSDLCNHEAFSLPQSAKRILDIIFSLLTILMLSPVFIFTYILVKIDDLHAPAIFSQNRVGKDNRVFKIYKFRTIKNLKPKLIIDPLGFWLRKYKFDEIPQLVNILRGEMTFIGPRPMQPFEADELNERSKKIFRVKPGLTSYASMLYIDQECFLPLDPKKIRKVYLKGKFLRRIDLDLEYLKNHSSKTDFMIILGTLKALWLLFTGQIGKDD